MDNLISRAAAIRAALHWYVNPDGGVFNAIKANIRSNLEQLPAVDAVPVVHARWVDEDFPYKAANANPRVTAICSECGNVAHRMEHGYSIFSKFCPNCGAKMDGDTQ